MIESKTWARDSVEVTVNVGISPSQIVVGLSPLVLVNAVIVGPGVTVMSDCI